MILIFPSNILAETDIDLSYEQYILLFQIYLK